MGEVTDSRVLLPALARIPGHLFWRAAARVTLLGAQVLPADVDLPAYAALSALDDGVPRSQQEVADAVAVSRTTMAKVAADLVAAGLVSRERNPGDRRSYVLVRTPAGADAVRRWETSVDALEEALTAPLDAVETAELRDALTALAERELTPDLPADVLGRVVLLLPRVHAWLYREFQALLTPVGLEPRHVGALTALESLGPVSQGGLARAIGVSAAGAVAIVDELEARDLVRRVRAPEDRRTQVIHLTDHAATTLPQARSLGRANTDRLFAGLPGEELERMLTLLRRVVTG